MQGSKKFYNKFSENSRSQIVYRTGIFRKLSLGAPDVCLDGSKTDGNHKKDNRMTTEFGQ